MTKAQIFASFSWAVKKSWTKARMVAALFEVAEQLGQILATHERHVGAYFWTPPASASSRRATEFDSVYDFGPLRVHQWRSNSCRNVYYGCAVVVGGTRKDIRAVKNLLRAVKAATR